MAKSVQVPAIRLDDYEEYAALTPLVRQLRDTARHAVPLLEGRTLWMINSTARGGGVAEMLPAMVGILRDLSLATEWVAIEADEPAFFALTKRIHNLILRVGE
jgi:trehalose synthase